MSGRREGRKKRGDRGVNCMIGMGVVLVKRG